MDELLVLDHTNMYYHRDWFVGHFDNFVDESINLVHRFEILLHGGHQGNYKEGKGLFFNDKGRKF